METLWIWKSMGYCGLSFRLDSENTILINAAQQCTRQNAGADEPRDS
jgi:hypothetical protein